MQYFTGLVSKELVGRHHSLRVEAFGLQVGKVPVSPLVDLCFQMIGTKLGYPHHRLSALTWVVWGFFCKMH